MNWAKMVVYIVSVFGIFVSLYQYYRTRDRFTLIFGFLGAIIIIFTLLSDKIDSRANEIRISEVQQAAEERAGEIERKLADRRLSLDQKNQIAEVLKKSGPGKLFIRYRQDSEAQKFSMDFKEVFFKSKWSLNKHTYLGGPLNEGVIISSKNPNAEPAKSIYRILEDAGFKVSWGNAPETSDHDIVLDIGLKPEYFNK